MMERGGAVGPVILWARSRMPLAGPRRTVSRDGAGLFVSWMVGFPEKEARRLTAEHRLRMAALT
jgi:hypothetical protein